MLRYGIGVALAGLLTIGAVGPVLAASPTNDTYAGREVVGAIPFVATVDTSEATTDADDADANALCGAPVTDASVWYEYTATADGEIVLDSSGSDYSVGFVVVTGSPGAFTGIQGCSPGWLVIKVDAGQTYAILVFDYQADGAGNGGELQLLIDLPPPPPTIDLSIDPVGSFDPRTGAATISGAVTCVGGATTEQIGSIFVHVTQLLGRIKLTAVGFTEFPCDGTTRAWSVEVTSEVGKLAGGKATVAAAADLCGSFGCSFTEAQASVTLRR